MFVTTPDDSETCEVVVCSLTLGVCACARVHTLCNCYYVNSGFLNEMIKCPKSIKFYRYYTVYCVTNNGY